jgi:sulfatase modifying factor 1
MKLTSQYIVNPKSRDTYINSESSYKSIRTTSTRLRMSDDRYVLNSRKKRVSFQVDGIGFNMLYCPRGKFMMGPNNISTKIERPFLLCETEVTQELFETIMGYNPSHFQGYNNYPNSNQRPVEKVTWYDAVMFCNKLSEKLRKKPYYNISNEQYIKENNKILPNIGSADVTTNPNSNGFRLPYEKEWVYATKAGTNNEYAGTNDVNQVGEVAWFDKNSSKQTHPVKGKKPNEWGFYDMSGNVWEWCYDLYNSTPITYQVIRGGSWVNDASYSSSAGRSNSSPGYRGSPLGFRVSASLVN